MTATRFSKGVHGGKVFRDDIGVDDDLEGAAQRGRIDDRGVSGDHPLGLQPADPAQAWRRGQSHLSR
jgi:hypothetical protein